MDHPLLQVEQLDVRLANSLLPLLHDVSFSLAAHQCLGVVGESGSGKSLLCRAIMGLLTNGFWCRGAIRFAGADLLSMQEKRRRHYHGAVISLIPQQPMTAFDPLQSIGKQMVETFRTHQAISPRDAKEKAITLLNQVRLVQAARRFDDYPAQLSGGMLQRVTLAIALGLAPRLLIADEPTTALDALAQAEMVELLQQVGLDPALGKYYPHQLSGGQMQRVCIARAVANEPKFMVLDETVSALDVAVQRQVLDLLAELRQRLGLTYLFISHDLTAVSYLCQRVLFLHQGSVIEQVDDMTALGRVKHPDARRLLTSVMV